MPGFAHAVPGGGGGVANNNIIKNPLQTTTITGVLVLAVRWLLGLVGILALLALIVGGVYYITSFGNDQRIQTAKKIITWAIIGLAIVILSFGIIQILARDVLGVPL